MKKNLIVMAGLLMVVILLIAGFFVYQNYNQPEQKLQNLQSTNQNTELTNQIQWQSDPDIKLCWDVDSNTKGFCDNPIYYADGFITSPNSTQLGAVEYCKHLEKDGVTISNNEINYWKLPTKEELITAMNDRCLDKICDFNFKGNYYWSSSLETPKIANIVGFENGIYSAGISPFTNTFAVRCVHN